VLSVRRLSFSALPQSFFAQISHKIAVAAILHLVVLSYSLNQALQILSMCVWSVPQHPPITLRLGRRNSKEFYHWFVIVNQDSQIEHKVTRSRRRACQPFLILANSNYIIHLRIFTFMAFFIGFSETRTKYPPPPAPDSFQAMAVSLCLLIAFSISLFIIFGNIFVLIIVVKCNVN